MEMRFLLFLIINHLSDYINPPLLAVIGANVKSFCKIKLQYLISNISYKEADKIRLLDAKKVKGFALKTYEGLCPSTLQAFKKA